MTSRTGTAPTAWAPTRARRRRGGPHPRRPPASASPSPSRSVDGVRADDVAAIALAALVVAVGDLLLRAPLRFLARRGSAVLALGLGLLAQVAVLWLALAVVPGFTVDNVWSVLVVLVLTAIVMAVGRWLIGASNSDYVVVGPRAPRAPAGPSRGDPAAGGRRGARGRAARRAARRCRGPRAARGDRGGTGADRAAVDDHGEPQPRGLVGPDPVDDAGEPGGPAARRLVPDPRVPLVGPGPRSAGRHQPPRGRRARRAAAHHGQGAARGRGHGDLDDVLRRRRDQLRGDEQVPHQGPGRRARTGSRVRALLRQPVRAGPRRERVGGGDAQGALPGAPPAGARRASRGSRAAAGTSSCAGSPTCCCAT